MCRKLWKREEGGRGRENSVVVVRSRFDGQTALDACQGGTKEWNGRAEAEQKEWKRKFSPLKNTGKIKG